MYKGYICDEKYEFLELIGSGGMSEVWSARRLKLGDEVAIKLLKLNHLNENLDKKIELLQEARNTTLINHPNICKVYDYVEDSGMAFIVMEKLDGLDLNMMLELSHQKGIRFPKDFCISVIREAIKALDAAHNINSGEIKSILHRDIKPANLFLTRHGEVKLLDLGISKAIEIDEASKTTCSSYSLAYTRYDLWHNGNYNASNYTRAHDFYSLGLVFYELLTGQRAYGGEGATLWESVLKCKIDFSIPILRENSDLLILLKKWIGRNSSSVDDILELFNSLQGKCFIDPSVRGNVFFEVVNSTQPDQTVVNFAPTVFKQPHFLLQKKGVFSIAIISIVVISCLLALLPMSSGKKSEEKSLQKDDAKVASISPAVENSVADQISSHRPKFLIKDLNGYANVGIGSITSSNINFDKFSCSSSSYGEFCMNYFTETGSDYQNAFYFNVSNRAITSITAIYYGLEHVNKILKDIDRSSLLRLKDLPGPGEGAITRVYTDGHERYELIVFNQSKVVSLNVSGSYSERQIDTSFRNRFASSSDSKITVENEFIKKQVENELLIKRNYADAEKLLFSIIGDTTSKQTSAITFNKSNLTINIGKISFTKNEKEKLKCESSSEDKDATECIKEIRNENGGRLSIKIYYKWGVLLSLVVEIEGDSAIRDFLIDNRGKLFLSTFEKDQYGYISKNIGSEYKVEARSVFSGHGKFHHFMITALATNKYIEKFF